MAKTCKTAIMPVIRSKQSTTPRSTQSERYLERHDRASCTRNCYLGWSDQGWNTALICAITGVNTLLNIPSGDTAEKFLQTGVLVFSCSSFLKEKTPTKQSDPEQKWDAAILYSRMYWEWLGMQIPLANSHWSLHVVLRGYWGS